MNREAISPFVDVVFGISGQNVNAVLNDVEAAMQNYPFPLEYHAEVQHDYQTQQRTQDGILLSSIIVAIGIFLLLQSASASWRMALAVFLTLPAMLVGGLLATFLTGSTNSSVSLFGLYAILGIGVRSAILLVRHYHHLESDGETFGSDLVLRGAGERFAPIIMTTLATALALLPFVVFGNIPGYEVAHPIAIVILGGLLTTTLLNLFVLPALYLRFGEVGETDELFRKGPTVRDVSPEATPGD